MFRVVLPASGAVESAEWAADLAAAGSPLSGYGNLLCRVIGVLRQQHRSGWKK